MPCIRVEERTRGIMNENRITYEDISKANETIKTTDIKGKEYAEVNQRIKAFRMVYPNGTIETEMISNENGVCIFRANIYNDNKLLSTGTAYEKENSTFINKTSYIENCETSAIGRALGMCGFGIDTSVASAEEVQNAIANQESKAKPNTKVKDKEVMITEQQKQKIKEIYTKEEILNYLNDVVEKKKLSDLTLVEASEFIKRKLEGEEK